MASPGIISGLVGAVGVYYVVSYICRRLKKNSVSGKVVLITGASSGVGEECAHIFYKAGAKLILCARREAELKRVKERLESISMTDQKYVPQILPLDLANLDGIPSKAKEALQFYGHVDVLVNNAGQGYRGTVIETSTDVHMKIMTVNYFGHVALTKELLAPMISNNSGHIVMMSSVQGKIAIPYRSAYGASKHAMEAFSDSLRAELAHTNVKVSVVNPGYIRTNISLNAISADGLKYGAMDRNIATGMDPYYIAKRVLQAVQYNEPDVTIAPISNHFAIYIRTLLPSLYFKIMAHRAKNKEEAVVAK